MKKWQYEKKHQIIYCKIGRQIEINVSEKSTLQRK